MKLKRRIIGPMMDKGPRTILAQSPTRGRLRMSSITLPMYMLAMTAQTNCGCFSKRSGPGCRP